MLENRALEIIIIALVVLVLFGAKRLPDSARALGKSLRILKAETRALREDDPTEPAAADSPWSDTTTAPVHAAPLPPVSPNGPVSHHANEEATPERQAHTA
ncbi:Sec-independent protein translocase subunit TatA [Streptacidiphilus jiangxiensis]|uniref:Sec-independent protein translocase protein TatA n=1 Tax=Streptacidiphilus jiangxiensis TaxID=235985 RepID=A0A1H7NS86_STRJI|nr:Sec-independent protein translocase subunit TatA [Streptacidiphilus jiangxiensis]SEL26266.1 sec-independent protein translocase protein TatA [Streptacidiphilus jiangxiensis]